MKVASIALRKPANRNLAISLTAEQFRYGFEIVSTDKPFDQQSCCMAANTFPHTNGNRLIAGPCDPYNSSQWFALG